MSHCAQHTNLYAEVFVVRRMSTNWLTNKTHPESRSQTQPKPARPGGRRPRRAIAKSSIGNSSGATPARRAKRQPQSVENKIRNLDNVLTLRDLVLVDVRLVHNPPFNTPAIDPARVQLLIAHRTALIEQQKQKPLRPHSQPQQQQQQQQQPSSPCVCAQIQKQSRQLLQAKYHEGALLHRSKQVLVASQSIRAWTQWASSVLHSNLLHTAALLFRTVTLSVSSHHPHVTTTTTATATLTTALTTAAATAEQVTHTNQRASKRQRSRSAARRVRSVSDEQQQQQQQQCRRLDITHTPSTHPTSASTKSTHRPRSTAIERDSRTQDAATVSTHDARGCNSRFR